MMPPKDFGGVLVRKPQEDGPEWFQVASTGVFVGRLTLSPAPWIYSVLECRSGRLLARVLRRSTRLSFIDVQRPGKLAGPAYDWMPRWILTDLPVSQIPAALFTRSFWLHFAAERPLHDPDEIFSDLVVPDGELGWGRDGP